MYLILFLFCRLFLKPTESWFVSNSYLRFALIYNVLVIGFYRGGFTLSHVILMFLLQWLMTGNRFFIAVSLMNPPMLMDLLCQRTDLQSLYTMWWLVNWRTNCHSRGFTLVVFCLGKIRVKVSAFVFLLEWKAKVAFYQVMYVLRW